MKKIYFVGIGGIGMSALAQYVKDCGAEVSGSDVEESPVTELLLSKGIVVFIGQQRRENVPTDTEVVIYSDAVPENNVERVRAKELGIPEKSYFEMLGEVSKNKRTIAVAGTHGKTTTTGMLAKILQDAGASPTAIIGSLVKDFNSNYLGSNNLGDAPLFSGLFSGLSSNLFVVEACEYRDHLLELTPQILVITNLEWDHTDYFKSLSALQETFKRAMERVPENGTIVTDPHNENIAPILSTVTLQKNVAIIDYTKEPVYTLSLPGEFNQMNARAAAAAARIIVPPISDEALAKSLSSFQGTWRRFEYKGKNKNGAEVYDDYAHHPTAIKNTLAALRAEIMGKITVAFHPHLYSRTRDLLNDFATAFVDADKVFIAPIYAAREVDDVISSEILAERMRAAGTDATALPSFDAIEKVLNETDSGDIIMTMGAGDIYKVADKLVAKSYGQK